MTSKYNHDEISFFVERLSQTERKAWTAEDLDKLEYYSSYVDSFTHNNPHPEHPNLTNDSKDFTPTEHRGSAMYTSPQFDKHLQQQKNKVEHKNVHHIGNIEVYDSEEDSKSNPSETDKENGWWVSLKEKISHLTKD